MPLPLAAQTVVGRAFRQVFEYSRAEVLDEDFLFSETRRLQLRVEFFNTFNQVNYDRPNSNVSSSGFGTITTAMDGRSIQFGLKFYY